MSDTPASYDHDETEGKEGRAVSDAVAELHATDVALALGAVAHDATTAGRWAVALADLATAVHGLAGARAVLDAIDSPAGEGLGRLGPLRAQRAELTTQARELAETATRIAGHRAQAVLWALVGSPLPAPAADGLDDLDPDWRAPLDPEIPTALVEDAPATLDVLVALAVTLDADETIRDTWDRCAAGQDPTDITGEDRWAHLHDLADRVPELLAAWPVAVATDLTGPLRARIPIRRTEGDQS